jgi:hypothetical protein
VAFNTADQFDESGPGTSQKQPVSAAGKLWAILGFISTMHRDLLDSPPKHASIGVLWPNMLYGLEGRAET